MNKKLTIRIEEKIHKALKKKVVDSKYKSIQALTLKLLEDWLKNE